MKEKLDLCELSKESMLKIEGGRAVDDGDGMCHCACWWANYGGSSTCDNAGANAQYGLTSPG